MSIVTNGIACLTGAVVTTIVLIYMRAVVRKVYAGRSVSNNLITRWIISNTVIVHDGRYLKAYVCWRSLMFVLRDHGTEINGRTMADCTTDAATTLANWVICQKAPKQSTSMTFPVRMRIKQLEERAGVN